MNVLSIGHTSFFENIRLYSAIESYFYQDALDWLRTTLQNDSIKIKGIDPNDKKKKGKQSKFSSKYSERIKSIKES